MGFWVESLAVAQFTRLGGHPLQPDRFSRPLLTAMPISTVVVAVMPVSMVIAPSPISGCPAVINASIPIPRSMDVIRAIVTADGYLQRVNGGYRDSAQTKQSRKKQH